MDRVDRYWDIVVSAMRGQSRLANLAPEPGVESVLLIDPEGRHVRLMDIGWRDRKRVNDTYLHVRIKDGKIWVEEDWTEAGIASELLRAGVPREDIVLGFQPPDRRHLTEFAVA